MEKAINYSGATNSKRAISKCLVNFGCNLNYLAPMLVSSLLFFNAFHVYGSTPFYLDKIEVVNHKYIETQVDSTGARLTQSSLTDTFDHNYQFFHSTGWQINDRNHYTRTVTVYRLLPNKEDVLNDFEAVLKMSPAEIKSLFEIVDIQNIEKSTLNQEDQKYLKDIAVVEYVSSVENGTSTCQESFSDEFFNSLGFIIFTLIGGATIHYVGFNKLKINLSKSFEERKRLLEQADNDIETLKTLLAYKKENLALFTDNQESFTDDGSQIYAEGYVKKKKRS